LAALGFELLPLEPLHQPKKKFLKEYTSYR
jgi:hypothetical protein